MHQFVDALIIFSQNNTSSLMLIIDWEMINVYKVYLYVRLPKQFVFILRTTGFYALQISLNYNFSLVQQDVY